MSPVTTKGKPNSLPQPGVSFLELREGLCKRPLGDKDEPPTRFCGAPAPPGSPYCQDCKKILYSQIARR